MADRGGQVRQVIRPVHAQDLVVLGRPGGDRQQAVASGRDRVGHGSQPLGPLGMAGGALVRLVASVFDDSGGAGGVPTPTPVLPRT